MSSTGKGVAFTVIVRDTVLGHPGAAVVPPAVVVPETLYSVVTVGPGFRINWKVV